MHQQERATPRRTWRTRRPRGHNPLLPSDDQAQLLVEQLLSSASMLGCGTCGLPLQEHGRSVIHRFVRPQLPSGYRYLDESGTGEEGALRRRPIEQLTIVTEVTDR